MSLAGTITIIDSDDDSLNQKVAASVQNLEEEFCYYHVGLSTLRNQFLPAKTKDYQNYYRALLAAVAAVARCEANVVCDLSITAEIYQQIQFYFTDLDVIWVAINRKSTPYKAGLQINDTSSIEAIAREIVNFQNTRSQYAHSSTRWVSENGPVTKDTPAGEIILLIGTSSAGKTSLLEEFQNVSTQTYLNIGLDTAIIHYGHLRYSAEVPGDETMKNWQEDDLHSNPFYQKGWTWVQPGPNRYNVHPHLRLRVGREARRTLSTMYASIAAISRNGFNVISDHCFHFKNAFAEAQHCLKDLPVTYVRLDPDLNIVQQREKQRGDRMLGVGEAVYRQMFTDYNADLCIDTGKLSAPDAAIKVLKYLQSKNKE